MKTKIIYEDKDILVGHKPAGLATQTARVGQQDMVSELKNYLARTQKGQNPYLGVIHRLDQPVEGLLVFAKNKNAAAGLTKQLQQGTLNKQYDAVICGKPIAKEGELVDYLYKTKDNRAQILTEGETHFTEAQKAVLQFHLLQEKKLDGMTEDAEVTLTWVDIHIDTGRFHQIRAQMSHAGMPLLGDQKYGTEEAVEISRSLNMGNVALCASRISLRHPVTGKLLSFQVEPEGRAFALF